MSEYFKITVLSAIQGLTEFLPVSSSGHLVLCKHALGLNSPGATLEVALHAGTLLSVLFFYRRRIIELCVGLVSGVGDSRKYVLALALSCMPAVVVFVFLGDRIEAAFDKPLLAGLMLIVTGLVLLSVLVSPVDGKRPASLWRGIAMGLGQALALLPGISRSGTTITIARRLGLSTHSAAEFSMLMVTPLIAGATLLKAVKLVKDGTGELSVGVLLVGLVVSAVVGYLAIAWLLRALDRGKFWMFGVYCLAAGAAVIVIVAF